MKVQLIFAWYDLWVGVFWDRKNRWLYIFLLPTVGVILKFPSVEEEQEINGALKSEYKSGSLPGFEIPKVKCMESKYCEEKATKRYSGDHYVCDYHFDKLNDEFDEEYK